jgi:osmoprotectant transport system permease protein
MAKNSGIHKIIEGLACRASLSGTLVVIASLVVIFLMFPLYRMDPNRVVRGNPVFFFQLFSNKILVLCVTGSFALLIYVMGPSFSLLISGIGILFLWTFPAWYWKAYPLASGYRVSPSIGFWLIHLVLLFYAVLGYTDKKNRTISWLVLALLIGIVVPLQGESPLSILIELRAQKARLMWELLQHLRISFFAFAGALVVSVPLGILSAKKSLWKGFYAMAGMVQTVPSLALFGLLMVPFGFFAQQVPVLRRWGISGIGAAPAITALGFYSMLPLMTGIREGLRSVPPQTVEAGRGLGFSSWSLFFKVELPLAMPLVMAGIRTAFVQTLGNAALAPLIGAGGLGFFIFQGIGQTSTDMVLLGVSPLLLLTLGSDAILGALQRRTQRSQIHADSLL